VETTAEMATERTASRPKTQSPKLQLCFQLPLSLSLTSGRAVCTNKSDLTFEVFYEFKSDTAEGETLTIFKPFADKNSSSSSFVVAHLLLTVDFGIIVSNLIFIKPNRTSSLLVL
jgi:hypothetical protein